MLSSGLPWWVRFLLWFAEPLPESRAPLYVVRVAHELVVADESNPGRRDGWAARCSCGWDAGVRTPETEADLAAYKHRTQAFFAEIANEMRRPSFGEMAASTMQALLNRAIEAKLYTPETR